MKVFVLIKSMFRNWVIMDRIRSDGIRGTELVRCFGDCLNIWRSGRGGSINRGMLKLGVEDKEQM